MSTPKRLAALTHTTANLIVQLRELNELREQVKKAELSARRSRPISRRKMTFNNERQRLPLATASITSTLSMETTVRRAVFVCLLMRVPDERDQTNYEFGNRRVFFRT